MSTTVDSKVLEMRFDNKQFESGISESMSSLEKFRQHLNLTGATKGLEDVGAAAGKVNSPLAGLGSAVENVQVKFSALQVMAVTALSNITNQAVNAGKRIASALTIDPIKTGFSEYETQIGAVQTILSNTKSKGTTLTDVNGALDELNTYADKTIYNFTEMTRNIGTFTAAGVDLDTSVSAIKGIANLAAVSGSTSQQASTAMYQLSQALASGTVKLMDWNSVVNAGMGGQVFQDSLKETAKIHGVNVDAMIKKEGSFRETLKNGWLTSEILTETLAKFTGDLDEATLKKQGYTDKQIKEIMELGEMANDAATKVKTLTQLWDTLKEAAQSGWAQTWEILVGDFEEAKKLFTEVSDTLGEIIGNSAKSRNELLQSWKDLGGRTDIIDAIKNAFNGVMNIIKPITEAFREIFPPITAQQLKSFSEGLLKLTERFKEITKGGSEFSDNLKRTFKGVFAVFSILKTVVTAVFKAISPLFGSVGKLGGGFLGITANIGDAIVKFDEFLKSSNILDKIFGKITTAVTFVVDKIKSFIAIIKEKFATPGFELVQSFFDRIGERMSTVKDTANDVKTGVSTAVKTVDSTVKKSSLFQNLLKIGEALRTFGSALVDAFSGLGTGLAEKMGNINFDKVLDFINTLSFGGIAAAIIKFVKGFGDVTSSFGGLGDLLDGVKGILDGVKDSLAAWQQQLKSKTLLNIAAAIAILAASILVISLIDSNKLASSLGAVTALFADLMGSLAIFSKISGKIDNTAKTVGAMIGLSVALLILAGSMKMLSSLSWGDLARGLIAIVVGLGALVGAVNLLPENDTKKAASAIRTMSTALLIFAVAMKLLGTLSWQQLAVGLIAVVVGLGAMVGAVNLLPEKKITMAAAAMIGLSTSLVILGAALKIMGSLSWEELGRGLIGMVAGLAALVLAVNLLPKDMALRTAGMVGLATSMVILGAALKIMGTMSWSEIARSLIALSVSLAAIALAMNFMTTALPGAAALLVVSVALIALSGALKILGTMEWSEVGRSLVALAGALTIIAIAVTLMIAALPGAAALVVIAGALAILTPVLLALGNMSWEAIGKGLLALAGAFAVIGVAALVLQPLVPVIFALAGAIALLGVAVLGIGVGLLAAASGLMMLAAAGTAGATAIVASITIIVTGIVGLIPVIVQKLGEALIVLCEVIIAAAPMIGQAVLAVVLAVINVLTQAIPPLLECLGVLLESLLAFIVKYVPKIVVAALELISGFLDGIAQGLPGVIQSAINLVISFINGMADGIRNNTDRMISAVNNLMDAVIEAIKKWFKNATSKGKELIVSLINGIKEKRQAVKDTAKELIKEAVDKIKEKLSDFKSAGKDVIDGFIQGIKDKIAAVGDAASSIGKKALNSIKSFLGINSPAKEFIEVGKYSDEGIIVGLKKYAGKVANAAKDVGGTALDSMRDSISHISDIITSDMDTQPTIRPILDLSEISAGTRAIDRMLDMEPSLGVMSNVRSISSIMNRNQNGSNRDVVAAIKDLKDSIGNSSGNTYNVNGITYDDGSNITNAVKSLVRAAKVERRI